MKTGATWDNLQVRVSPLLLFLAFNSTTEPVHWAVEKPPVFVLPVIVADSDTLVGENFHLVGHTTIDLESNLVGGWPTPLKKYESQLGIWFHIYGKILQTTNQNISLQKPLLTTINHHYGCCKPPTRCILLVHSPQISDHLHVSPRTIEKSTHLCGVLLTNCWRNALTYSIHQK